MRSPPRGIRVADGARRAVGVEPAVPRKTTSRSTGPSLGWRSARDAQDGPAVRDLAAAVDRAQPRPAERTGCRRREIDDRERPADEACDIAVVEPRGLV